jgi:hypothetical protein
MSRKKISTTIYVTPEQNDRLKQLHERTKVPVAVYIREGIDLVLRHYAHLLPGQLPLDVTPLPPAVSPREVSSREAPAREPAVEMPASLPNGVPAYADTQFSEAAEGARARK